MFKKINIFWLSFVLIFLNFSAVRAANTNFVSSPTIGTGASINFTPSGSINGANYVFGTSKLDSAGSSYFMGGNVGVGTSAPKGKLAVASTLLTAVPTYTNTTSGLVVTDGGDIYGRMGVLNLSAGSAGYPTYIQAGDFSGAIYYNLLLNPISGNVGIGTTGPGKLLEVNGQAKFNNFAYGTTPVGTDLLALSTVEYVNGKTGGSGGVGTGTSGQTLRHNGTGWVANSTLFNDGTNVGIGTTNPITKLNVSGGTGDSSSNDPQLALSRFSSSGNNEAVKLRLLEQDANFGTFVIQTKNTASSAENDAYYTNALAIMSNGNVGIGTTGPSQKLDVNGSVNISEGNKYLYAGNEISLPSDENLVGYWPLDDGSGTTVVDGSGHGNNGTANFTPTYSAGISGSGITFASGNQITLSSASSMGITGTSPRTVSLWFKKTSSSSPNNACRMFGWAGGGASGNNFELWHYNDRLFLYVFGSDFWGPGVSSNAWYHVVVVFDGTSASWYENGVLVTGPTAEPNWNTLDSTVYIGGRSFAGNIDEVRVYNRALTAAEIKALYLYPAGNKSKTINARQLAGDLIVDSSGYVGIGTTGPGKLLEVNGQAKFNNFAYGTTPVGTDLLALSTVEYVNGKTGGSGGVGTGTSGQTLRHNGTGWVANSTLFNDGTNVGIGTVAPISALNVAGTTALRWGNGANPSMGLVTIGGSGSGSSLFINTPSLSSSFPSGLGIDGTWDSGTTATINIKALGILPGDTEWGSNLAFYTTRNNTLNERMRIDKLGNVGIGTTNPGAKLEIVAGGLSVLAENIRFSRGDGFRYNSIYSYSTNAGNAYLQFRVHDGVGDATQSSVMTLMGNGNVGIGTPTPRAKLEIAAANAVPTALTSVNSAGTLVLGDNGNVGTVIGNYANTGGEYYATYIQSRSLAAANVPFNILLNPLGGNVGIGTTGPTSKLDVVTSGYSYVASPLKGTGMNLVGAAGAGVGGGDGTASGVLNIIDNAGMGINNGGTITLGGNFISSGNAYGLTYAGIKGGKENVTNYDSAGYLALFTTPVGAAPTEKVRITSTGNVGIGTTNPITKLNVSGGTGDSSSNDPQLALSRFSSSGNNEAVKLRLLEQDANFGTFVIQTKNTASSAENDAYYTNALAIMSNGNVGIGTTSPGKLLEVNGQGKFNNFAYGTTPVGTDLLALSTVEYVNGALSNNIEIGGRNLFLSSSVNGYGLDSWNANEPAVVDNGTLYDNSATIKISPVSNQGIYSDGFTIQGNRTYTWSFMIKASEAFSPGYGKVMHMQAIAGGGYHYETNIRYYPSTVPANVWTKVYATFDVPDTYATYDWHGYVWYLSNGQTYYVTNFKLEKGNKPTDWTPAPEDITGTITVRNGNVGIGMAPSYKLDVSGDIRATSFIYNSSDINLKKNIVTIQSPLDKIMQLRGVTFDWKKDNSHSIGLIAQEVEKVFPELVTGQEGNKAVAYGNLVAPLIEAVKAQQKEIDTLNIRIKILETASRKK